MSLLSEVHVPLEFSFTKSVTTLNSSTQYNKLSEIKIHKNHFLIAKFCTDQSII